MKLDIDNAGKYGAFKAALVQNAIVFLNGERVKHVTKLDTKAGTLTRIRIGNAQRPLPDFVITHEGEFEYETLTGEVGVQCMRTGKTWGRCA